MEKNKINILISGVSASGKSTFAASIANLCREHGIEVEHVKEHPNDNKWIEEKLDALGEKGTKVNIREHMVQRDPLSREGVVIRPIFSSSLAKKFRKAGEKEIKKNE